MAIFVAMILGRTVWARDANGWRRESFDAGMGPDAGAMLRLAEILSANHVGRSAIVFEPEGVAHETVETPNVSREVFASLARVRSEHPVVDSGDLGWGIEHPDPAPGGTFSTLIHSELAPGLVYLRDACNRAQNRFSAAWTGYTAIAACVDNCRPAHRARLGVILTNGFSAVATCGLGKRSFRAWFGAMAERDWKAFSLLIGDSEPRPSPSIADAAIRRGGIVVISEGDPGLVCPFWDKLRASGRVKAVVDMEVLATSVARIPASHPANLLEAFPVPHSLNRQLAAATIVGFSSFAVLGAIALNDRNGFNDADASASIRAMDLRAHLKNLNNNQREMLQLRRQALDGPKSLPVGRHEALLGLAAAIPDALTLTSFTIGKDGEFELEALIIGVGFDSEGVQRALAKLGFVPNSNGGWMYDAPGNRLLVRGRYVEPGS